MHIVLTLILVCGCEKSLDDDPLGQEFTNNLLQDGQADVAVAADLQVYMGDKVAPDQFKNLTATLADSLGNPVSGQTILTMAESMVLVFDPESILLPETDYVLTVTAPGGEIFVFNFTTCLLGTGEGAPVVTITSPADGALAAGVIKVEAAITENSGLAGNVISLLEGGQTGYRSQMGPFIYYINTVNVLNGLRRIEVQAADIDCNFGFSAINVNVQNGDPGSTPFWIFVEDHYGTYGLDLNEGIRPSPELKAALPAKVYGPGVTETAAFILYAFTDSYHTWADDYFVGDYRSEDGMTYKYSFNADFANNPDFKHAGVPCLKIYYLRAADPASPASFNLPASTLEFVMPDHSTLTVYLPQMVLPYRYCAPMCIGPPVYTAFYIAADGSSHYAYPPNDMGFGADYLYMRNTDTDMLTPSAALANPPAAGP